MPRPANLSLALLDPSNAYDSDDELFAAMDAAAGPPASDSVPLLVCRPDLRIVGTLDEATARLQRLIAWSQGHPEWWVVGGALDWEREGEYRRVIPVLRRGRLLQGLVVTSSWEAAAAELKIPKKSVITGLLIATDDEVSFAVEVDPRGAALRTYFERGLSEGVDVHVVLRSASKPSGVPRGNIARSGGLVVVCGREQKVVKVVRVEPMRSPDLDPEVRSDENVRRPQLIKPEGAFTAVDGDLHVYSSAIPLAAAAPEAAEGQPLGASTAALTGLAGGAQHGHAYSPSDVYEALSEPLPGADGKLYSPTQAELDDIKADGDRFPVALGPTVRTYATDALSVLPPEHMSGAHLRVIVRNRGWGKIESLYNFDAKSIVVNIPFNCEVEYEELTLARADWWYMKMKGGDDGNSCWGRRASDREAPRLRDYRVFRHALRHEVGHAVDAGIGFAGKCAALDQFGGWTSYSEKDGAANQRNVVNEMLLCAAKDALIQVPNVNTPPDREEAVVALLPPRTGKLSLHAALVRAAGDESGKVAAGYLKQLDRRKGDFWAAWSVEGEDVQMAVRRVCNALTKLQKSLYWRDDGGAIVFDGRGFHGDQYGDFQSYLWSARARRLSNYQFTTPSEYFAELYAFYFATPADPGRFLREAGDAANAEWFRTHLDFGGSLLGVNGLRRLP